MKSLSHFITPLKVTPLADGKNWQVVETLKYEDKRGDIHVVPAGFVTDFASIPNIARIGGSVMFIGFILSHITSLAFLLVLLGLWLVWIADNFNCDDKLDAPATLHDNGYKRPRFGKVSWVMKFYWDALFYEAMKVNGVHFWKRFTIWFAVASCGWMAWHTDGQFKGEN